MKGLGLDCDRTGLGQALGWTGTGLGQDWNGAGMGWDCAGLGLDWTGVGLDWTRAGNGPVIRNAHFRFEELDGD